MTEHVDINFEEQVVSVPLSAARRLLDMPPSKARMWMYEHMRRQKEAHAVASHPIQPGMRVQRRRGRQNTGIVKRTFWHSSRRCVMARVEWQNVYPRFGGGSASMHSTLKASSLTPSSHE